MSKIILQVDEMSCGGCAKSVERIIEKRDGAARVVVTLSTGRVEVESDAEAAELANALSAGGFPARIIS